MRVDVFGIRYATVLGAAMGLLFALPYALAQAKQTERDKPAQQTPTAAAAQEKQTTPASSAADNVKPIHAVQKPYLGVGVEPLHPAFWTHLREVLEHNQGVLVAEVAQGSPAEKAGLKPHDILMTFGDHKLYSPHELTRLVQAVKAGDKVNLRILREGKPLEISVALGERAEHMARHTERPAVSYRSQSSPEQGEMRWESFDSMTLAKVGHDRFKVEIAYLDNERKMEHRTFEGSRQQIQQDVRAQKDLPKEERGQLLRALDLRDEMRLDVPTAFYTPDGHMTLKF